jgi:hypothetical protein
MIFRAVTRTGTYVSLRNWIATLLRVTNTTKGRLRCSVNAPTTALQASVSGVTKDLHGCSRM